MENPPTTGFLSILEAAKLPAWALVAIIFSGVIILFAEQCGIRNFSNFQQPNDYIIAAIIFAVCLCISKLLFKSISWCYGRVNKTETRALKIIPLENKCYWCPAQDRDNPDLALVQIMLEVDIANISKHPIRLSKVTLKKPSGSTITDSILLPAAGSRYYDSEHKIPPGEVVIGTIMILRCVPSIPVKDLAITVIITDQWGANYKLKMKLQLAPGLTLPIKQSIFNMEDYEHLLPP